MSTKLELWFDGAVEPVNPGGTGSWGWVIASPEGDYLTGMGSVPAAPTVTNNLLEWYALGYGLRRVADSLGTKDWLGYQVDELVIRGDSKLVVNQLTGQFACNAPNLRPLLGRCLELLTRITAAGLTWRAEWIPRDANQEADALSVAAWTTATGRPFPERTRKKQS